MRLSGHFVTFCLINNLINLINGAVRDNNLSVRQNRHLATLFQFFRGLHYGENYHHIPPYYFLPSVLVLPAINQQQNTLIQESSGQENYQEINKSLHMKKYAKLVSSANTIDINETVHLNKTIFLNNSKGENNASEKIKFTQFDNATERETLKDTTLTEQYDAHTDTSTEIVGFYPPARNNSGFINSLSLTTDLIEKEVENHTKANLYKEGWRESYKEDNVIDSVRNTKQKHQKLENQLSSVYKTPFIYNSYNSDISDNNDFLPLNDNRWQNFSTEKKDKLTVKGFKPLAGLYYDGFLHRPLAKKSGFEPI